VFIETSEEINFISLYNDCQLYSAVEVKFWKTWRNGRGFL